jgi:thiamine-monophosphate kinase
MHDTPLGPGAEFDAIRSLLRGYGVRGRGIGDDAALLDVPAGEQLVVSTDAFFQEVHFRLGWMTPGDIGYRATVGALSDLAAMAARPLGVVIALGVPEGWRPLLGELAEGVAAALAEADTDVVGGNLSRASELSITTTVFGSTRRPLRRSGGRPGDLLWVTGRLGGPATALDRLERGQTVDGEVRTRFLRPRPRLAEALWLAEHGVHAAIDISDGLVADARHLAAASGVRVELELERIPLVAGSNALDAAASGEEYELAVCAPETLDRAAFERVFGLPLTPVGRLAEGAPAVETTLDGERVAPADGHDHFSS